ncbi:MAG: ATP-binding protein [Thermoguttaceae bacterium]
MSDHEQADFQRMLETEKLEAMAEFAAGAGHEINNPLTVISGRAQLLLRDEPNPERRHALALITSQAMRVYEMIADMMLFARPPRPERRSVEIVKLVDDLISELLARCAKQETAICRIGDADAIWIEADSVQLAVALRAICQNSLESLQNGGHIEICVEARNGRSVGAEGDGSVDVPAGVQCDGASEVSIRIHDDGPGVTPEERRHMFDPFYSARQAGRGLGLGLSKAWRIVTNHGGRIEVASQPGQGITLTVFLPSGPSGSGCG